MTVDVEVPADGVAVLRMNRPPVNAFDHRSLADLREACSSVALRDDVHGVVLAGTEGFFSAGADLDVVTSHDHRRGAALAEDFQRTFDHVAGLPQLVLAAIDGIALGGGLEVALACDVRISSSTATFGFPESDMGLIPGGGGTVRALRTLRTWDALDLLVGGVRLSAFEARDIGLLDEVVDTSDVTAHGVGWFEQRIPLRSRPLRAIKSVLREDRPGRLAFGREREGFADCLASREARDALTRLARERAERSDGKRKEDQDA